MAGSEGKIIDSSKQLSSAERNNMSALDMAVYGKAMATDASTVGSNIDFEDDDWKMIEETAKSGGVGSWFASKVDFQVNGTRIRGKKGYSVKGGVVPLFDGAAIDLRSANLKAPKKGEVQSDSIGGSSEDYQNWVMGTGGQMVLAPVGVQNVIPFRMDQIVVTEKGVMGKSDKTFRFVRGEEEITGESLVLKDSYAILYGVSAKKENEEESVHSRARVTRTGLQLYYISKPEVAEAVLDNENKDGTSEAPENKGETTPEPPTSTGKNKFSLIAVLQTIGSQVGETKAGGNSIELKEGNFTGALNLSLLTDKEKNEILKAGKQMWNDLKGHELKQAWSELPDWTRNYLYEHMPEDEIKKFTENLSPDNPLMKLLGLNQEREEVVKENKGNSSLSLVSIPVFPPFLDFGVTLKPDYSLGATLKGSASGLYNLWRGEEEKPTDITIEAGLKGHLGLKASAMLNAGLAYILNVSGGLYAKAGLKGAVDAAETFLAGKATLSLKKQKNGEIILNDNIRANIDGGLKLVGSIGAEAGISSKLLSWQKTLLSIQFKEWKLAELAMKLGFSKDKNESNFFSGWTMDEANFSVQGIKNKFLEGNGPDRNYGFFNVQDMQEKAISGYEDAKSVFEEALLMLNEFNKKESIVGIAKDVNQDRITQAADREMTLQNKLLKSWSLAQVNLEQQQALFDEMNGEHYQKSIKQAQDNVKKHEERLNGMRLYKTQTDPQKAEQPSPLEYYKSLCGKSARGFKRSSEKQAKEKVYHYDNVLQYEKNRYDQVTHKHRERIAQLETPGTEGKTYKGKEVYKHKSLFSNTQKLKQYEKDRLQVKTKSKEQKISDLMTHMEKLKKDPKLEKDPAGMKREFIEHYASTLKDTGEILQYGDSKLLLSYEKSKLPNKHSEVDLLLALRSSQKIESFDNAEAVKQYINAKKNLSKTSKSNETLETMFGKNIYKTASADELVQFEEEQMMKHGGAELKTFFETSKDRKEEIGEKTIYSKLFDEKEKGQKEKKKAVEREYKAWLKKKSDEDLKSCMTLELLLHYEKQRSKDSKSSNSHQDRIKWLNPRLNAVNFASAESARELEINYIKEYFETFKPERVMAEVKKGDLVDLKLVQLSLKEKYDQKIDVIKKAKEGGSSSQAIWQQYKKAGGKKTEISTRQKEKVNSMTLDDIVRFETFSLSEEERKHWERYEKLSQMNDESKSYQEMLNTYKTIGGGKGFAKHIKDQLKKGTLEKADGSNYEPEDIFAKEEDFKSQIGTKHRARLELIEEHKDKPYQELLKLYRDRTNQDKEGRVGQIKNVLSTAGANFRNGFEKSLKDVELTPEQILEYEKARMEEVGQKHKDRIQVLTGDQDSPSEEEKNERLQEYLQKSKRFKKDKDIKSKVAEEEKQFLAEDDTETMYENIITYESGRIDFYRDFEHKLSAPIQETSYTINELNAQIAFCHSLVYNFKDLKDRPEAIWENSNYEQFKQMTENLVASKDRDDELKAAEAEAEANKQAEDRRQREEICQQLQAAESSEQEQAI